MQYSNAQLITRNKQLRDDGCVIELVIWRVAQPIDPCTDLFKYRLYFGKNNQCFIRYDNERGKGDHRHVGQCEEHYRFESLEELVAAFERDIRGWSKK